MKMTREISILAGKEIIIKSGEYKGQPYIVEDWWINISHGKSWMASYGNPACMCYAFRTGLSSIDIPDDNEVLYGKIGGFGYLIHISEIE